MKGLASKNDFTWFSTLGVVPNLEEEQPMLKAIKLISLLAMLITPNSRAEEESFLEGISVLGDKKIAYLSIDGNKISIHEGEEITLSVDEAVETWRIVRIEQGSVLLKSENGLATELRLDSRLPTPETEATEDQQQPFLVQEAETPPVKNTNNEVPPGSRVVQTPFGHFIIKDNTPSPTSPSIQPLDNPPTMTEEEEVQPGHHIVRTPFGDFIVKDTQ